MITNIVPSVERHRAKSAESPNRQTLCELHNLKKLELAAANLHTVVAANLHTVVAANLHTVDAANLHTVVAVTEHTAMLAVLMVTAEVHTSDEMTRSMDVVILHTGATTLHTKRTEKIIRQILKININTEINPISQK